MKSSLLNRVISLSIIALVLFSFFSIFSEIASAADVYDHMYTGNSTNVLSISSNSDKMGQSFKPRVSTIQKVELRLSRDADADDGGVIVELCHPDSMEVIFEIGSMLLSDVSTSTYGRWETFEYIGDPEINPNWEYAIIVSLTANQGGSKLYWRGVNNDVYPSGEIWWYDGAQWHSDETKETAFKTYGFNDGPEVPSVPDGPSPTSEGIPTTYTFKGEDAEHFSSLNYYVNWGDGESGTYTLYPNKESGEEVDISHTWYEEGAYVISFFTVDPFGEYSTQVEKTVVVTAGVNQPPDEPEWSYPSDGATNVPVTASLLWFCSDPDPQDDLYFDVYFGDDINNRQQVAWNIPQTQYNPSPDMEYNTKYYWNVTAKDGEYETNGPIWSFTTIEDMPDPIHHWTFDDISGSTLVDGINGNNGIIHGAAHIGAGGYDNNGFLTFDGVDDYVDDFDPFSIECLNIWIKPDDYLDPDVENPQGLLQFISQSSGDPCYLLLADNTLGSGGSPIGNVILTLTKNIPNWPFRKLTIAKNFDISNTEWHMITFNKDGDHYNLFFDGVEKQTETGGYPNHVSSLNPNDFQIAKVYTGDKYKGCIDDIRVYDTPLTDPQIETLFSYKHDEGALGESFFNPHPANNSNNIDINPILSWDCLFSGPFTVHFGTDPYKYGNPALEPHVNEKSFDYLPTLAPNTRYYWYVKGQSLDGNVVEGALWNFETGNGGNDLQVTIDYNDSRCCYKSGDKVTIYANFTWINFVEIDHVDYIILDHNYESIEYGSMDKISHYNWLHNWTVPPGHDGNMIVTIQPYGLEGNLLLDDAIDTSKTIDNTEPAFMGIANITTMESATIFWMMEDDEAVRGIVEYSLDRTYGSSVQSSSYTSRHTVPLTNLIRNSTYYYRITAYDVAGNPTDPPAYHTFRTLSEYEQELLNQTRNGTGVVADAGGPYNGSTNNTITVDASKSYSVNGTIIWYRWDFDNDGTYDTSWIINDPTAEHIYRKVRNHTIKLEVEDSNGLTATDTTYAIISERYREEIENLTRNNRTTINLRGADDTIVIRIEVIPGEDIENVTFTTLDSGDNKVDDDVREPSIDDLKKDPKYNKSKEFGIYRYINISLEANGTYIQESKIKNISVIFKVSKEWIENNNINSSTIKLLRYHDDEWQIIDPNIHVPEESDEDFIYYSAEPPGLSTFAVVGSKVVESPEKYEEPEIPWIVIIGFIISAIVILIFILFKAKLIYIEEVPDE